MTQSGHHLLAPGRLVKETILPRRSAAKPSRFAPAAPLLLVGILAASLLYPVAASAVTLTFAPTADSYVSSAAKTTNYGSASTMLFGASPSQHAYLMFNVTGTGSITNATLRIWATAAGTGASVHATTTAWTESGLTYTNAPAYGATLSTVSGFAAGTWLTYNVTSLVTANGLVAFMYTSASSTPLSIAAREDAAHAPQLVVTAGGNTAPGAPTGVSAAAGNAQATVSWVAPASNGGSAITGYTVTSNPGNLTCTTPGTLTCPVTGLTNGTPYTFSVTATNAIGTGPPSTSSNAVTPVTVPGAPTNVTATAGNTSATVNWTVPSSNGGSAIIDYTVTSSGSQTATAIGAGATSATVSGLTNGTPYTFTVHARNNVGAGAESAASTAVTPAPNVPGQPTSVGAVPGDSQATVSWTAPANNGGSAIDGYTATANPGALTCSTTGTLNCVVMGLSNGTAYTFTVKAHNIAGDSAASAASSPVTPATVPDAPTGVSAVGGNGSATVNWSAPAANGGSPITGYAVTSSPDGRTCTTTGTLTCTVTSLTNGTAYTFTVIASNAIGPGAPSSPSSPVTPQASVPGQPTSVSAVPDNSQATVSWSAPSNDGGSAISDYTVTSNPGNLTCSTGGPLNCTVTGLTNGTAYTFTVIATNGIGPSSPSSPSTAVTPATVPDAPTSPGAVPGNGSATVNWTIPVSDGGSAIIDYKVSASPGTATATAAGPGATSVIVTGLANGTTYTFTVHARNGVGNSLASDASTPVTPQADPPGPPTGVSAVPGDAQATVSWTIPSNNGGSAIIDYTVTPSGSATPVTVSGATANSALVTGLTNGTPYTFTVHARNGFFTSSESAASTPVTPNNAPIAPGPPTNTSAAGGNASATVTWTIPASNGGGAIDTYTVKSTPGNFTATVSGPAASSATVSGLTNGTSYTFTVHAHNIAGNSVESTASNAVIPSTTPPTFLRQPYLTDTTPTSTMVNFASSTNTPMPVVRWDLASGNCLTPPNSVTAAFTVSFAGTVSGTTVFQDKATISGLTPNTLYCYRVFQNGIDLKGSATTFRTAPTVGSTAPFKFAVIGDWGQGTPQQASVFAQIANGAPNFLMTVGDNVYAGGSNSEYGDLNGGNVFPAGYLPKLGGSIPIYAAQGNHGFTTNLPYIQTFPQDANVSSSNGKFGVESYCCAAGTSGTSNYASSWYAFTWGNARFYVLEAAWGDSNGAYQGDATSHWNGPVTGCTPCGQEMTWLQNDLANNASVPLKFAFFHYPLYSDSPSEVTDTYLNGAAPHLEGVLAANNVTIAFTGHSHQYERNVKQAGGPLIPNYITGGGGAALGSVGTRSSWDAYAIASYHYLLVSVSGNVVTVSPTDMNGVVFDQQTYSLAAPTAPDAPTNVTAVGGNTQATVNWTIPASNGGSAIIDYTVTSTPGNISTTVTGPTASSAVVSGLTNGQAYTFKVTARNSVSSGPASAASNSVTPNPATVPGAPTNPNAVGGTGQATVTWTIPASNGGSPIIDYTATSNPGGFFATVSGPTATSAVVSGLANSTAYTFTVTARNAVGTGPPSGQSNSVTPTAPTAPDPPASPSAVAGNASATVSWTIPASNGGSAIIDYTATSSPGGFFATVSGPTATSVVVSGLTNGTAYTFTVRARNSIGSSSPSVVSNAVTPVGGPTTFTSTADSYVSSAAKTTNYGSATTMLFGATPSQHAYLMFNVTGAGSITNATLRIWATAAGTGASVHSTTTAWTESGLIYNNAPAYGATLSTVSNFAAGTWLTYNVTSLVTANGLVAFMYTSASSTPLSIASREDVAHAPQLVVTRGP